MSRRRKGWFVVASLFTLINLAGAPIAALSGEPLHSVLHVVLLFVGAFFMRRFAQEPPPPQHHLSGAEQVEQQFDRLQQSLDAIAIEVERIGEAQRFMTKLGVERAQVSEPQPRNDES